MYQCVSAFVRHKYLVKSLRYELFEQEKMMNTMFTSSKGKGRKQM